MNKSTELAAGLRMAQKQLAKGEYAKCLELCEKLRKIHKNSTAVIRAQADAYALSGDTAQSITTRTELVQREHTEPCDLYDLARHSLELGQNENAIEWCKQGIIICEKEEETYYLDALRFYLALGLLNSSLYEEGKNEVLMLPDGYKVHIRGHGNRTREELLKLCTDGAAKLKVKVIKFQDDD